MSRMKIGEATIEDRIAEAQRLYESALQEYRNAKTALHDWDRWEHLELTPDEAADYRQTLVEFQEQALKELREANLVGNWLRREQIRERHAAAGTER
jgi:hypothetical protein